MRTDTSRTEEEYVSAYERWECTPRWRWILRLRFHREWEFWLKRMIYAVKKDSER